MGPTPLRQARSDFVVLSARSLVQRTISPDEIAQLGGLLVRDKDFPPEKLVEKLKVLIPELLEANEVGDGEEVSFHLWSELTAIAHRHPA